MAFEFKHLNKIFVFIKPSSNSPLIFALEKNKKLKPNWVLLDNLPEGKKVKINPRTNRPLVSGK